jgi:hypothetical protein
MRLIVFYPRCRDLQRKCWWDGIEIELKEAGGNAPRNIKLWARRVWTLELSLVRTTVLLLASLNGGLTNRVRYCRYRSEYGFFFLSKTRLVKTSWHGRHRAQ